MAIEMTRQQDNFLIDSARAVVNEALQLSPEMQQQLGIVATHERKWKTLVADGAFRIAVLEEPTAAGHRDVLTRYTWPLASDTLDAADQPDQEYYLTLARTAVTLPSVDHWYGRRMVGQTTHDSSQPPDLDPSAIYAEAERRVGHIALKLAIARLATGP